MRIKLLLLALLFSCLMVAQNRLRVFKASVHIIGKNVNGAKWYKVYKGKTLYQSDLLRIPANSSIEISDENSSLIYRYKTIRQEDIKVDDLLKKVMSEDKSWISKFFKTMFSKSKVNYNPIGATRLSSSPNDTILIASQKLCTFFKNTYNGPLNSIKTSKNLFIERMKDCDTFTFRIRNISNEGYYFNVVKVNADGIAHVCYNLLDVENVLEASLFVGSYETIDMSRFNFFDDGECRYYLIASKHEFSWKLLEDYLKNDKISSIVYEQSDFLISPVR